MFPNPQLSTILSADRQSRLRNAASRRRLVRRSKLPPTERPLASVLSVVWPDDADCLVTDHSAHCVT